MGKDEIKVEAGERRKFSTGAEKQHAEGKGMPVLVPGDAIIDIAKHFEKGAEHYGARNWEKGIPLSEILNSLERHLQQLKLGMTDEPHTRAMVWNAIVYLATKLRIERGQLPAELDDMTECALSSLLQAETKEPEPAMHTMITCARCSGYGIINSGTIDGDRNTCPDCKGRGCVEAEPEPEPEVDKTVCCACGGDGIAWLADSDGRNTECPNCKGTGKIVPKLDGRNEKIEPVVNKIVTCAKCGGAGKNPNVIFQSEVCSNCEGTGKVEV